MKSSLTTVNEKTESPDSFVTREANCVPQCSSFDSLPSNHPSENHEEEDGHPEENENEMDDPPTKCTSFQVDVTAPHRQHRTASEDFHIQMSRCESVSPMNMRWSEMPTIYRPFYTGVWYKDIRTHCYPHGWNKHCWPLLLSFLAEVFTIWGSFSCQYFKGAAIEFTGNRYGIWTLEDVHGKCQLWSVLFYAYNLGGALRWARVMSMCAMVLGLAVLTTMAQAMQCHAISYGVGLILFLVFLVSVSTTSTFNIWIVWALFNYILFVLIVRATFVHPVARRISHRGKQYIAACQVACHVFSILTLVVLRSDFCTCDSLSPGELEGRITEFHDPCVGVCSLHISGYMVICASALWLLASIATIRVGVQPPRLYVARPPEMYAHYSRESITTRMRNFHGKYISPLGKTQGVTPSGSKSTITTTGYSDESNLRQSSDDTRDRATTYDVDDEDNNSGESCNSRSTDEGDKNCGSLRIGGSLDEELQSSPVTSHDNVDEDDDDDDWLPKRSRCQKCCCDFRIKPRSRNEKIIFWTFRFVLGFIISLYVFLVTIMIGSRAENLTAQEAPDTSPYFITDVVCAFDPQNTGAPFRTFVNRQAAEAVGWKIAHCGACGDCSNMDDIEAYVETRQTIAASAKKCGPTNFLGTFDELVECLQGRIDFSEECTICWAENMRNTGRECLFTCVATLFTGFMASNNVDGAGEGWMNHCLYCDEKLSGPAFVTCSGVARRRLGIVSEIERNPAEQCPHVDVDWVSVDFNSLRSNEVSEL